ncbi:MAG: alkaline phosphatase [Bacteroidales bacterium]|nr:alkaline phosphatase [Bacteroidales bacterium]
MLETGMDFIGSDSPFFFMCEGGKIDWTAHENKTMPMVMDMLEFNDAVKVAYDFYLGHPDETLIVVTADHETGGLSLGCGRETINWEKMEAEWIEGGRKNMLDEKKNMELNKECSIGWTTHSHTGSPVPVFAIGKGAEKFSGRMDNTDIKGKIL